MLAEIERKREDQGYVVLCVEDMAVEIYGLWDDPNPKRRLTRAEYVSTLRAVHAIVRKFPQYALAGGKGRTLLYLYEPGNKWSAETVAERTQTEREFREQLKARWRQEDR